VPHTDACHDRDAFLEDLRESVGEVRNYPERFKDGMAPVYGMAATMPDRSLVSQLLVSYTEALLKA
jgi:sphinganine-1-phosphate aldolase